MSEPSQISALPFGLLSLIGNTQSGRYPDAMSGYIQPVLDMRDFLTASQLDAATNTIACGATGFFSFNNVAPGAFVYLQQCSVSAVASAVNFVTGKIAFQMNNLIFALQETSFTNNSAAAGTIYGRATQMPVLLLPGVNWGFWVEAVAGTGANLTLNSLRLGLKA
jgi:hypothetical protein